MHPWTRAKVRGAPSTEHFFSITTLPEAESFMELAFQLGGPASCTVHLSSPQNWGCMLLSTKMLGIWSQVCLLSQLSILTSSALRCNFKNIFLILFNYLCGVGGKEGGRQRERRLWVHTCCGAHVEGRAEHNIGKSASLLPPSHEHRIKLRLPGLCTRVLPDWAIPRTSDIVLFACLFA